MCADRRSYSARQARGSIATAVLRCMRKRPLTRTGAPASAASTSPRLNSRLTMTLPPASSCNRGASSLTASSGSMTTGSGSNSMSDHFERVFGKVTALRHDADQRFPDIAHFAARERQDWRGVIAFHARCRQQRRDRRSEILGGEHRDHARRLACRGAVDCLDARVRMLAAAKRDMQDARRWRSSANAPVPLKRRGSSVRLTRAPTIFGRAWISAPSVIGVGAPCATCPIARRRGRRSSARRSFRCGRPRRAIFSARQRSRCCAG